MPDELEILIDNSKVELPTIENIPITISYKLEDAKNFSTKQGATALNIEIPATVENDEISNGFHNPSIEDLTENTIYRGIRKGVIRVKGNELLVGKSFLKQSTHTDKPVGYEYDIYGNNSDWIISLKELTLYDILKHISYIFSKDTIINSWLFDGTNENLPYCFIPIRYGAPMATFVDINTGLETEDYNMELEYMKPSISKYWILYWAFKSIGYTIESSFFDNAYFRRQLMPWTWGNYLSSEGTQLDVLKFLAKSSQAQYFNTSYTGFANLNVDNDFTNGAFDNSDTYQYVSPHTMQWTYLTAPQFGFGLLEATFHASIFIDALVRKNSDIEVRIQWFKNGIKLNNGNDNGNGTLIVELNAPAIGNRSFVGLVDDYLHINVNQSDIITAKIYVHTFKSGLGEVKLWLNMDTLELDYFRIPIGGTINFTNYLAFKNYKFLDFLGGVIDEFNLSVQSNSSTKRVYFEPTHKYSLNNDFQNKLPGYFNDTYLDWSNKQDLSKRSLIEPFTDSERELYFKYKEDANDGTLKKIQDRNNTIVGQAKYLFPERFTTGKKEIVNRFFAPTMHYDVKQWAFTGFEIPQMIIMAPENISNLSQDEAQNTFQPKSIYYKGLSNDYKWVFDSSNEYPYPFAFAVNYKPGGENDPILSYSDEVIGTEVGQGLLRRFFHQRLVNMAEGNMYTAFFLLNNNDVANFLHREFILCRGQKWELIQLDYKPLKNESTQCILRKWVPIKNG